MKKTTNAIIDKNEKSEIDEVLKGLHASCNKATLLEIQFNTLGDSGGMNENDLPKLGGLSYGVATICSEILEAMLAATELLQSLQDGPKNKVEVAE